MTLTEFLKKEGAVIEVDVANLPEGLNIDQFVTIMTAFTIVEQDVAPVVIKDTRENRELMKKQYDQPQ
tara:strand:+ start:3864 stop:4067 length:204 start_codon:yes stop_codon:yes gene_type:complete